MRLQSDLMNSSLVAKAFEALQVRCRVSYIGQSSIAFALHKDSQSVTPSQAERESTESRIKALGKALEYKDLQAAHGPSPLDEELLKIQAVLPPADVSCQHFTSCPLTQSSVSIIAQLAMPQRLGSIIDCSLYLRHITCHS